MVLYKCTIHVYLYGLLCFKAVQYPTMESVLGDFLMQQFWNKPNLSFSSNRQLKNKMFRPSLETVTSWLAGTH